MITRQSYAARFANRLLAGAGLMSFDAYRVAPGSNITVLSHGITRDGSLTIECWDDDVAHLPNCEVRLDISKQAPEWDAALSVASLHALARITWRPGGGRIRCGEIDISQMFLHWPGGTEPVGTGDINPRIRPIDEIAAHEAIVAGGRERLALLQDFVDWGDVDGLPLSDLQQDLQPHEQDQIWIADLDPMGVMVVTTTKDRIRTSIVPMADVTHGETDMLRALAEDSL